MIDELEETVKEEDAELERGTIFEEETIQWDYLEERKNQRN